MNLIPSTEVPSLPNDLLIGWNEIQDNAADGLPFVDQNLRVNKTGTKRWKEHVSSRKLFAEMLSQLEINLNDVDLRKTELGKPFAKIGTETLHTSFSHSSKWVVCALSTSFDVGIDCEPLSREVNPRIFDRILDADEKKLLNHVSALAIWTMKEAVVKCIGTGIRSSLQQYALKKEGDYFYVLWENERIQIVPFIWENHQLSIAWRP